MYGPAIGGAQHLGPTARTGNPEESQHVAGCWRARDRRTAVDYRGQNFKCGNFACVICVVRQREQGGARGRHRHRHREILLVDFIVLQGPIGGEVDLLTVPEEEVGARRPVGLGCGVHARAARDALPRGGGEREDVGGAARVLVRRLDARRAVLGDEARLRVGLEGFEVLVPGVKGNVLHHLSALLARHHRRVVVERHGVRRFFDL
mmetsp:Transcript_21489/g.49711  ORF Transcript_21489/g.49711 Transcript_21489/m.49711 type:complete len:206 (+) Transcript_21489:733-1350(+)